MVSLLGVNNLLWSFACIWSSFLVDTTAGGSSHTKRRSESRFAVPSGFAVSMTPVTGRAVGMSTDPSRIKLSDV